MEIEKTTTTVNPMFGGDCQQRKHCAEDGLQPKINSIPKIDSAPTDRSPAFILLCVISILLAWIYLTLPSNNFWMTNLVRNGFWSILATFWFVEIADTCLPGTPVRGWCRYIIHVVYCQLLIHLPLLAALHLCCSVYRG